MSVQAITLAMAIRDISATEKLVLIVLANYADDEMKCWPSQKTLAEECCLSERAVRYALSSLEAAEIISRAKQVRSDGSKQADMITMFQSVPANGAGGYRQMVPDLPANGAGLTSFEPSEELPSEAIASSGQPNDKNATGSLFGEEPEPVVVIDLDKRAWSEAVRVLTGQGGMPAQAARTFFGGLLSRNSLIARDLLPSLATAEIRATMDPKAYLIKAAQGTAERRGQANGARPTHSDNIASMRRGAEKALAGRGGRESGDPPDSLRSAFAG